MPITIDLHEDAIRYLTVPAKGELKASIDIYAKAILREASLIEAEQRSPIGDPSISKPMIKDAVKSLRIFSVMRRPPWTLAVVEIASRLTTLLVGGGIFSFDKIKENNMIFFGFVLLVLAAAILNTIEVIYRRMQ